MADPALAAARERVATVADSLNARDAIDPFQEELGSSDYARWRRELIQVALSCGEDFHAALVTAQPIPRGAAYPDACVLLDTAASVPTMTMPQVRQLALLSFMRRSLQPSGEAMRLVRDCWHAGGQSTENTRFG